MAQKMKATVEVDRTKLYSACVFMASPEVCGKSVSCQKFSNGK
jgi:hypothetical protein